MKIDNVRPTVDWYAKRMDKRLREKDKERGFAGWHDGKIYYYAGKAKDCLLVIFNILNYQHMQDLKEKKIHLLIKKCIDGGNFFMMLADNFRDELIKRGIEKEE